MDRFFLFWLGIFLLSIGLTFLIVDLNLLAMDQKITDYFIYYIKNWDFLYLIGGGLLIYFNKKK